MPTGYTADVANGKISDFTEYALLCARAFGACMSLRDEPLSSEIPEFEPCSYYAEDIVNAEKELSEFLAMDEIQQRALHAAEQEKNNRNAELGIARKLAERQRYEAMLAKAKDFKPPSPEHENYAKFLIDQLESSIDFDCDTKYFDDLKQPVEFETWKLNKLKDLKWTIEYRTKVHREDLLNTASRNRWVGKLKEALGIAPQVNQTTTQEILR